jgi:hypothetical protein
MVLRNMRQALDVGGRPPQVGRVRGAPLGLSTGGQALLPSTATATQVPTDGGELLARMVDRGWTDSSVIVISIPFAIH